MFPDRPKLHGNHRRHHEPGDVERALDAVELPAQRVIRGHRIVIGVPGERLGRYVLHGWASRPTIDHELLDAELSRSKRVYLVEPIHSTLGEMIEPADLGEPAIQVVVVITEYVVDLIRIDIPCGREVKVSRDN